MKTKFFKTGLPIMAFLMAIGLAFATDRNTSEDDQLVSGFIHQNDRCVRIDVTCDPLGTNDCFIGGNQVFLDIENQTTCKTKMGSWF